MERIRNEKAIGKRLTEINVQDLELCLARLSCTRTLNDSDKEELKMRIKEVLSA